MGNFRRFSRPSTADRIAAAGALPSTARLSSECFSRCRYLHRPLRLLPAGATVAGRDSHPLRNGALSRRTEFSGLGCGWRDRIQGVFHNRAEVFALIVFASLTEPLSPSILAQQHPTVELQVGSGYVKGYGVSEGSATSLPTYDVGVVVWLKPSWWDRIRPSLGVSSDSWGMAARHIVGPGTHLYDRSERSSGLSYRGAANLKYTAVTVRHRRFIKDAEINVGFGFGWGRHELLSERPSAVRWHQTYGGLVAEVLVGFRVSRRIGAKVGFAGDPIIFGEIRNLHPAAVAVVSFW